VGGPLDARLSPTAPGPVTILPVGGLPEIQPGADLAAAIIAGLESQALRLVDGDIVVVASKVVSKAEGQRVQRMPVAGERAIQVAEVTGFDAGVVELILSQSREVLRARSRVLVVETVHGLVCANAGVDRSNTGERGTALLLPEDSDASARALRDRLGEHFGVTVAVLVSDTFGRPFRNGQVNVAVGIAGMHPVRDYRGQADPQGHVLEGTELAVADEVCSAAELVMNKLDRVPVAVVRGYAFEPARGAVTELLRPPAEDYFR
jgi:coenzyme F420-0:L-glutamate ligase/coenzyme F420-1:gamma-L-glutamate ligase